MPYAIVKNDNGDAWVEVRGKKISPPAVSAETLRKMKRRPKTTSAMKSPKP